MKHFLLLLATIFYAYSASAQGNELAITIQTANGTPLEGATAQLHRATDSALLKTALTDATGKAVFSAISAGRYFIKASAVGHLAGNTPLFTIENNTLPQLQPLLLTVSSNAQLQGVTVTVKKPFIQKLADRIVVNVESSLTAAGSSALDVLEQSPGITVDNNDVISLRGRNGVIIMIDGKPSPLSGTDLANYLRGLPAGAVERIDIITNPSSKYDAAGNSGIIDIHMKKDQRLGTNGTFSAGYGQGFYPKANTGITLNHRNKKWNLFGNYNYNYRKLMNHLFINRNFFDNGVLTASDDKANYATFPVNSHTARAGADFSPNKNTIIGFVVNSNTATINRSAVINSNIRNGRGAPVSSFQSLATGNDANSNLVANINLKTKLDTAGRELTADIDYGIFKNSSLTRTASTFFNLAGQKRGDDILDGDQEGDLRLQTVKIDYVHPLKKGAKWEAGAKGSYVYSNNNAQFFNVLSTGSVVDSGKTNRFHYQEYNAALYSNLSKEWTKWNVQVGLRAEQTVINTKQERGSVRFKNDYLKLFPTAFINYKLAPEKTAGISVSRRIDRPGFQQLNPFLFQIDATIYATGAPNLLPQFTWSTEASYTVKNKFFSLGYSRTTNPQTVVLSRVLDVLPNFEIKRGQDSNITVQIPVNLTSSDYFGFTATLPAKINNWWSLVGNANVFYNHFNGALAGVQLSNGAPAANLRLNNNFTFKKGWSAELNGNLRTGGRDGYTEYRSQWGVAAGVQKTVLKGKGTLRLNATDIFWTSLPRATITYEGKYIENFNARRETRVANLAFTYRFGNNKVQAARRRTTASEEEIKRTGN